MVYAPILIPTLCRSEHFIRCVESLKRNTWAKYTDVFVALDYPLKDNHWIGYNEICEYLNTGDFTSFASFNVIKRTENYGPGRNMRELREKILEKYDRFIRTDDDAEFATNFLEYMNKALEVFENEEDIVAVTGYSYPIDWDVDENSNVMLENFIAPMWGTGFWKSKYLEISDFMNQGELVNLFRMSIYKRKYKIMTDACWCDYVRGALCAKPNDSLVCQFSDVALRIYLAVKNKYVAMPVLSKVRNWGFDGSGVYCQNISSKEAGVYAYNYSYQTQPIDMEREFSIILDHKKNMLENRVRLNRFDRREFKKIAAVNMRVFIYMLLGEHSYRKIVKLIKGK